MGARSEGSASKAGLALLGLLSVAGFLPVVVSSSTIVLGERTAAVVRPELAAPLTPAVVPRVEHASVAWVIEPTPPAPPVPVEPAPTPEPAPVAPPLPAVEVVEAAPARPVEVAAPAPEPELVAVAPAEPASTVGVLGGQLTTTAVAPTLPLVDGLVQPLVGSLLGGR